jgi:hypothetical protein
MNGGRRKVDSHLDCQWALGLSTNVPTRDLRNVGPHRRPDAQGEHPL